MQKTAKLKHFFYALGLTALMSALAPVATAQEPVAPGAVREIFQQHCVKCHGLEKQKGELLLDTPEGVNIGGENGAVIVAGNAAESKLCQLISLPADDPDIMPSKGDPLTAEQIAMIAQWINEGASFEGWDIAPPPPPVKANAVRAIFESRCFECHGPDKQKEDLRLDTVEFINKGSEHGPVIVAGNPDESKLCQLIHLPAGDPDIMPAKGEPLTDEQKATIARWIQEGANFEAWDEAIEAATSDEPMNEIDVYNPVNISALYADDILAKLAEGAAQPAAEALKPLEDAGVQILPIHQGSPLLRVNFQFIGDNYNSALLDLLQPIAANVTWLNLSGTGVADADLAKISGLGKLTALHLENTGISDVGVQHLQGFQHLEYLNLYNTQVSDASLDALKALAKLKRLYLWQTKITAEAAKTLNESLPDAVINMGLQ